MIGGWGRRCSPEGVAWANKHPWSGRTISLSDSAYWNYCTVVDRPLWLLAILQCFSY